MVNYTVYEWNDEGATCYSHSSCGSNEFCYQYSNSWSSNADEPYCTDCIWCDYCSYGIDGDCGAECDHTKYYGMDCLNQDLSYDLCQDHSDCDGSAPFCYYQYSNLGVHFGTCESCDECHHCGDGIDYTCGDVCGQTTYYGMDCLNQDSSYDYSYSYEGDLCQDHSDCDGSAPFCYHHYSNLGVDVATCASCDECLHCGDGIDNTCGDVCGRAADGDDCAFSAVKTGMIAVIAVLVPLIGCFVFGCCLWYICCRQSQQSPPPQPPQPNMILVPNNSAFTSPQQQVPAAVPSIAQYAVSYGDGEVQPQIANVEMVKPIIATDQKQSRQSIIHANAQPEVAPPAYAYANDQELANLYSYE